MDSHGSSISILHYCYWHRHGDVLFSTLLSPWSSELSGGRRKGGRKDFRLNCKDWHASCWCFWYTGTGSILSLWVNRDREVLSALKFTESIQQRDSMGILQRREWGLFYGVTTYTFHLLGFRAITSISTRAPRGRPATATAERAG